MTTVLIVIHLMVVLAMIGLVLLQRSEGGALGIGGGAGGFMTGRGAGNVLTHATGVLAIVFFATSIGLALLARLETRPSDIFDTLPGQTEPAAPAPAAPAPVAAPVQRARTCCSSSAAAPRRRPRPTHRQRKPRPHRRPIRTPQTPPAGGSPAPATTPQPAAPAPVQ